MGPAGILIPWRKALKYGIYSELILLCFGSMFLMNSLAFLFLNTGYFIPAQSSMFHFVGDKENSGSGEYWIAGYDHRYFYLLGKERGYYYISRNNTCDGFDRFSYATWCPDQAKWSPHPHFPDDTELPPELVEYSK